MSAFGGSDARVAPGFCQLLSWLGAGFKGVFSGCDGLVMAFISAFTTPDFIDVGELLQLVEYAAELGNIA